MQSMLRFRTLYAKDFTFATLSTALKIKGYYSRENCPGL